MINEKRRIQRFLDILSREYSNFKIDSDTFSFITNKNVEVVFTFWENDLQGLTPNPKYTVSDDPKTITWYRPSPIYFKNVTIGGVCRPDLCQINMGVKGNLRKIVSEALAKDVK